VVLLVYTPGGKTHDVRPVPSYGILAQPVAGREFWQTGNTQRVLHLVLLVLLVLILLLVQAVLGVLGVL
jgi:hypothetical protein